MFFPTRFFYTFSVILLLSIFSTTYAASAQQGKSAQGKAMGHGHGKFDSPGKAKAVSDKKVKRVKKQARFSKREKATIENFFDTNTFPATSLPPGIAMNVARGKPLPPGIAKRPIPSALLEKLPVFPGHEYVVVGRDVALVNSSTGIVTDIISNVLQ